MVSTNFYDLSWTQSTMYLDGRRILNIVKAIIKRTRDLSKEEWRRATIPFYEKAAQTEPLQANHQFTPGADWFYRYTF